MGSDTVRSVIFDPFIFARSSTLENGISSLLVLYSFELRTTTSLDKYFSEILQRKLRFSVPVEDLYLRASTTCNTFLKSVD